MDSDHKDEPTASDPTEVPGKKIGLVSKPKDSASELEIKENSEEKKQSEVKALHSEVKVLQDNLYGLAACMEFYREEWDEDVSHKSAIGAGQLGSCFFGTLISFDHYRNGRDKEALCAIAMTGTILGIQFLTEGALMHYHRHTHRRSTPRLGGNKWVVSKYPWIAVAAGAASIATGLWCFSKSSK